MYATSQSKAKIKPINNNGSILIRFQVAKQSYTLTPIKGGRYDDPVALGKAQAIAESIARDIQLGEFDPTLEKYKVKSHLTVVPKATPKEYTVIELWNEYFDFRKKSLKAKTVEKYENLASLYQKLGNLSILDAIKVKSKLESITTIDRTRDGLMYLNACCKWAVQHDLISVNPYDGMYQQLPKPNYQQNPEPNAFTKDERDLIIEKFKGDKRSGMNYSHYTSFVEFLFYTGCRPSEAVGLTWDDVSEDCSIVRFNKSKVQVKSKIVDSDKSKNNRVRTLAVSGKATELLQAIKPETVKPKQLVFCSPDGIDKPINYRNFARRAWSNIVDPIKPDTTPYCCRDTFITLQLINGTPASTIAKWCDTSTLMIDKYYADKLKLTQIRPTD